LAKTKWKFWKGYLFGVLTTFALLITIATGVRELLKRAKPKLLDTKDCEAFVDSSEQTVEFKILLNNAGSKDCSVVNVELLWPDGLQAQLTSFKPPLPQTLLSGHTELLSVWGYCCLSKISGGVIQRDKLIVPPEQDTIEGTVSITFNTKNIIKQKISFILPVRKFKK